MTKNDTYVALLGDVVASRRLAPRARARLQDDLRAAVAELNRRWHKHLPGRFAITGGDQLECLLDDPALIWDVVHGLRYKFSDVDWIIACGRGPLTTALKPQATAPELDGPCFHLARAALEHAKTERRVLALAGFGARADGFAAYYSALYWSWTPKQRRLATQLRWMDQTPGRVVERPKVHPTAVSHMKRRLAWPLVEAGDTMFRAALQEAS
jgi:SatD family protein